MHDEVSESESESVLEALTVSKAGMLAESESDSVAEGLIVTKSGRLSGAELELEPAATSKCGELTEEESSDSERDERTLST